MRSNLDRGFCAEPESAAPRVAWRTVLAFSAVLVLGAVCGSMTYCKFLDETNHSTFSATESAGRIWQLLDSENASSSQIRSHALNICTKAEQAVADLAAIAERAESPLREQLHVMLRRIENKARESVPAAPAPGK